MNRLDASDLEFWEATKDNSGLSWKEGDFNEDGLMDIEMFTSEGRQILYQLKQ